MESCPALDGVIFNAEPSAWKPTNSHCSALPEAFWLLLYCALHTASTPSRSLYIPLSHRSGFSPTEPLFFEDRHHVPHCKSSSYCIDHDSQQRASCHSLRKPQKRFSLLWKKHEDCSREMPQHGLREKTITLQIPSSSPTSLWFISQSMK